MLDQASAAETVVSSGVVSRLVPTLERVRAELVLDDRSRQVPQVLLQLLVLRLLSLGPWVAWVVKVKAVLVLGHDVGAAGGVAARERSSPGEQRVLACRRGQFGGCTHMPE